MYHHRYQTTIGVLFILVSIYIFGYLFASHNGAFDKHRYEDVDDAKNYSVSNAIGNGNKELFSIFVSFGLLLILLSHGEFRIYSTKYSITSKGLMMFLLLAIGALVISIAYINPLRDDISEEKSDSYNSKHVILAAIGFGLVSFYVLLTGVLLLRVQCDGLSKALIITTMLINITGLSGCVYFAITKDKWGHDKKKNSKKIKRSGILFEVCENLQVISLIFIILYAGWSEKKYKTKCGAL